MHIVVIQTAFLGDLFLSIPLLRNIKTHFPDSKTTLIARQGLGSVFQSAGLVDQVFDISKGDSTSYGRVVEALRGQRTDYLICPHKSFRSGLMAFKIKTTGPKVSFSQWWNFTIFNKTTVYPSHLPDALRQMALLAMIQDEFRVKYETLVHRSELENSSVKNQIVDFRPVQIPDWAQMNLEAFVSSEPREKTVVVAPGSVWNTKKWTENGFTEVAGQLLIEGYNVVLMGSKAEHELCESIRRKVPQALNLAGQTSLEESLKLLAKSQLLVSNDSGAMHLASSVKTPVISVFGPTTLDIGYRPWNQNAIVVQKGLECRPCGKHGHKECPLGTHECMKSIPASQVLEAAHSILQ